MLTMYGSSLVDTVMGEFLKMAMFLAKSEMSLVESSRSRATVVASLPVSFWMF